LHMDSDNLEAAAAPDIAGAPAVAA
jgi:hypothetical protein